MYSSFNTKTDETQVCVISLLLNVQTTLWLYLKKTDFQFWFPVLRCSHYTTEHRKIQATRCTLDPKPHLEVVITNKFLSVLQMSLFEGRGKLQSTKHLIQKYTNELTHVNLGDLDYHISRLHVNASNLMVGLSDYSSYLFFWPNHSR